MSFQTHQRGNKGTDQKLCYRRDHPPWDDVTICVLLWNTWGFFVVVFVLGFLFVYFSMCWPRHGQSSKELILYFYHGILRPNLGPRGCTASKFTSWAISQAPTVFVLMEKRKVKSDITNSISVQLHAACVMFVFLLGCLSSQITARSL